MRLNGAMLEGPELITFCEMRKRSYLAPPPRSTTPPVEKEKVASSSVVSLTGPSSSSSNTWSTWSERPDADKAYSPTSTANPPSATHDPWAVDTQDAETEILPDGGESSISVSNVYLFHSRPNTLDDVKRIFIDTLKISRIVEGIAQLPPW